MVRVEQKPGESAASASGQDRAYRTFDSSLGAEGITAYICHHPYQPQFIQMVGPGQTQERVLALMPRADVRPRISKARSRTQAKAKILRLIAAHPGMDEYDLSMELGLPIGQVFDACQALRTEGKIEPETHARTQ